MRLPRDVSGPELIKALRVLGYGNLRQRGSHIRVTTQEKGEHHEVIPNHHPIKVGTLQGILKSVVAYHELAFEDLLKLLAL